MSQDVLEVSILPRDPNAPTVPALRRKRRAEVERRLLRAERHTAIMEAVAVEFGVSPRIVSRDIGKIRREWERQEDRLARTRRIRVIRSLERLAAECVDAKDYQGARDAQFKIGRLLGMGNRIEIGMDGRTANAILSLADVLRVLSSPPSGVVMIDGRASLALPSANGNGHAEGNGHAS